MAKRGLRAFHRAISILRSKVHPDLAIQQIAVYLEVCLDEGITMPEIGERLDMPKGSVSRNVKRLSRYAEGLDEEGNRILRGYDLIRTEPDLVERRRNAVFLTEKGETIWKLINQTIEEA